MLRRFVPAGLRGWPPEEADIVALDVETTGLDPATAEVISIGAVPIQDRRVRLSDRFEAVLRRDAPTHEGSVRIHRLRAVDLEHGLPPAHAMERFRDWLGERPILGYCVDFDRAVLDRALKLGKLPPLDVEAYDLRRLFLLSQKRDRHHGAEQHEHALPDLDGILEAVGIPALARHTAMGDAAATALAYIALRYGQPPGSRATAADGPR
jgi:DNA polymerase-3 subunit epsilon